MEIPPTILIIAGFIIIILGIGAGMLLSSLNEEGEPEEESGDAAPPGGKKGRYTPVTRLWRAREGGALVVEMDGKAFVGAEALTAEQRAKLEQSARDLRGWLGMGLAAGPGEPAPAQPQAVTNAAAQPAYTPPTAPYAVPAVSAAPTATAVRPAAVEPEPVQPAPGGGAKSIVSQIEDILQDMIESSPLRHEGLHLVEDPLRGVLVRVGANTYEGIDAVPEGEAKKAIRAAVAEWEKTQ